MRPAETFNDRSFAGRQAHSAWVTLISELGLVGIVDYRRDAVSMLQGS